MLSIPSCLMITPVNALGDSVIGEAMRKSRDILRGMYNYHAFDCLKGCVVGDLLLTMYMSYELSKGRDSFYHPFFQILPEPGSIARWSQSELDELQDEKLVQRAENKKTQLLVCVNLIFHLKMFIDLN